MKINKAVFDKEILGIADRMKTIKAVSAYNYYIDQIENCTDSIKEHEFRLTVVGEFSSGKSTFLNALIGKAILPSAKSVTTATITYIHNVKKGHELENKAVIHYRNGGKDLTVDILTEKEKFQDHLSALNDKLNVTKEIECVDVYVNCLNIDAPFVIVDTPGLNACAEGHRDITMHEIMQSHASICLFHIKGIQQTDLDFMKVLMKHQKTFFFVLNHIDELNEEDPEDRIKEFADEIKKSIYNNEQTPEYVFGISAWCALAAQDTSIKSLYQNDKEELTPQKRQECYQQSRFEILKKAIFDYLAGSEKEIQFYLAVLQHLQGILTEVKESSQKKKSVYEADLNAIPEIKILEDELKEIEKNIESNKKELSNKLGAEIERYRKNLEDVIRTNCGKKLEEIGGEISRMSEIFEVENAFKDNKFGKKVTDFYTSQCDYFENEINRICKSIYGGLLSEMGKMLPRLVFKDKVLTTIGTYTFDGSKYVQTNVQSNLRSRINDAAQKVQRMKDENREIDSKINSQKKDRDTAESNVKYYRNKKNSEIRSFENTRPEFRKWKEKKGLLGRAWAWITCSDSYNYYDNQSEIDIWDAKRDSEIAKIEQKYAGSIADAERTVRNYKSILANLEDDKADNEKEINDLKNEIRKLEIQLQESEHQEKMAKENAKRDWIKQKKQELQSQIDKFLSSPNGEVIVDLKNGVWDNLRKAQAEMGKSITIKYDQKIEEYRECVSTLIDRQKNKAEHKSKEDNLVLIKSDLDKIDACEGQITKLTKQIS
ncbi:MAG: dynamin family protein [Bacteroidales bacterium]|nr:dynamin family protein [Bacteroidales bacterium]